MPNLLNAFDLPGRWYKANLHAHTTTSDGLYDLPRRVEQYRRGGYGVLAITDHWKTNDVSALSDKRMLVVSGMEFHPSCPTAGGLFHMVALNVPHGFTIDQDCDAGRAIEKVRQAGGLVVLAHPHWCGLEYRDFAHLKGLSAVEVWNATCARWGRPCSETLWAQALDRGMMLPALANDDTHGADTEDVMESWTWLKLAELTPQAVQAAVESGACYASTGPEVKDFGLREGKVVVRCSPAAEVHFNGGAICNGARKRATGGKLVTRFAIDKPNWPYVRAVVVGPDGRRAWTNPILLSAP